MKRKMIKRKKQCIFFSPLGDRSIDAGDVDHDTGGAFFIGQMTLMSIHYRRYVHLGAVETLR